MNKTIKADYTTTKHDYYIGVDADKSITITLSPDAEDGQEYIIKLEMQPPLYNRKVRIVAGDASTIDGYTDHVMTVSHNSVFLIRNNGKWFVIR